MTRRTLLLGGEKGNRVVNVPRPTAAKQEGGLVMVLTSGKQVVEAAVAVTAAVVVGPPK